MAKFGEGDPRWIVEHRDDGHNVNGWHWTEKDRTKWAKTFFENQLCKEYRQEEAGGWTYVVKVKSVKSCTGDAVVRNRKGKKVCGYDFQLKLEWEGKVLSSDLEGDNTDIGALKGTLEIPEFADGEIDMNCFAYYLFLQ
mmetsp:Transcript_33918/g.87090  ORF Transcript_33918/g.87090 Transcript_33918/m.87090 type:complete len:139 (+) Transcript_33918:44-460(+)